MLAKPCILAIDNDAEIRDMLRRGLRIEEFDVQVATDGEQALAILQMAEQQGSTDIRVTHEQPAQRLGTVPESASLGIRKFQNPH